MPEATSILKDPHHAGADRDGAGFSPFSRGIYVAFIEKGIVKENSIEFYTNFGIRLTCRGTGRTLAGFLGYRKFAPDGTVEILLENWQVNGKEVNYSRVKSVRKKALTETKRIGKSNFMTKKRPRWAGAR